MSVNNDVRSDFESRTFVTTNSIVVTLFTLLFEPYLDDYQYTVIYPTTQSSGRRPRTFQTRWEHTSSAYAIPPLRLRRTGVNSTSSNNNNRTNNDNSTREPSARRCYPGDCALTRIRMFLTAQRQDSAVGGRPYAATDPCVCSRGLEVQMCAGPFTPPKLWR